MDRDPANPSTTPSEPPAPSDSWLVKPGRAFLIALAAYAAFLWFLQRRAGPTTELHRR